MVFRRNLNSDRKIYPLRYTLWMGWNKIIKGTAALRDQCNSSFFKVAEFFSDNIRFTLCCWICYIFISIKRSSARPQSNIYANAYLFHRWSAILLEAEETCWQVVMLMCIKRGNLSCSKRWRERKSIRRMIITGFQKIYEQSWYTASFMICQRRAGYTSGYQWPYQWDSKLHWSKKWLLWGLYCSICC